MEIERLRKELNELLENVVDHSSRYSENRPIPSLEISFVLKKINKMQETLTVLKYLLEQQELANKTSHKQRITFPKMEEDDDDWDDDESVEEVVVSTEKEAAEKLEEKITDIEKLPIAKLVDAFSLNDRYLYANELFNKDMNAFNEAVKSIDGCTSFDDAQNLFNSLETEKEWDKENEHVIAFFALVERRFM